jgi:hypothetical protein
MEEQGVLRSDAHIYSLQHAVEALTGQQIEIENWQESLFDILSANEVIYQIAQALESPRPLAELPDERRSLPGWRWAQRHGAATAPCCVRWCMRSFVAWRAPWSRIPLTRPDLA